MGRLVSMYFLHNVAAVVTHLTVFVAICIGLILFMIIIMNMLERETRI